MESRNAELSLLLNKLQSEEAALRDSLAKVGSLNESLAQDKTDLNAYIIQVQVTPGDRNNRCLRKPLTLLGVITADAHK